MILNQHFRHVWTLNDYFKLTAPAPYGDRILVASSVDATPVLTRPIEVNWTLEEVLNRAVSILVKKSTYDSRNVLTLGFRRVRYGDTVAYIPGMEDVEFVSPSSIYENIRSSRDWQDVLSRVGDAALLDLLINKSLFMALENGSYLQLAGPALYDTPAKKDTGKPAPEIDIIGSASKIRCLIKKSLLYRRPTNLSLFGEDCLCWRDSNS